MPGPPGSTAKPRVMPRERLGAPSSSHDPAEEPRERPGMPDSMFLKRAVWGKWRDHWDKNRNLIEPPPIHMAAGYDVIIWRDHDSMAVRGSKWMTAITRHGHDQYNVPRDQSGYIKITDMQTRGTSKQLFEYFPCPQALIDVVEQNPKRRFELKIENEELYSCALQGHSSTASSTVQLEHMMQPVTLDSLPPICVHGTYSHVIENIMEQGLWPGGPDGVRAANHFATSLPKDRNRVISGLRKADYRSFLDLRSWFEDRWEAYMSENDVVCIQEVILPAYFCVSCG